MHTLARRYIKTGIAFLVVGLAIGVWMLVNREFDNRFATPFEMSAHTHALLVGFTMQMIMGVALWLFPRPARDDTRYRPFAAEVSYWVLTLSTAARVAGELARHTVNDPWIRWTIAIAGVGQAIAILLFFQTMWFRIRPLGSKQREQAGKNSEQTTRPFAESPPTAYSMTDAASDLRPEGPEQHSVVLTGAEPQLYVSDITMACDYYQTKLGFAVSFTYGEPPFYAQVARDGVKLNLRHVDAPVIDPSLREAEQLLSATITLDDAKPLFFEYQMHGVEFAQPLRNEPWGAYTFVVRDIDGNLILFAGNGEY